LGGTMAERSAKFKELPEEEQRKYSEEAEKLKEKFKTDMAECLASREGKLYTRRVAAIKQKALVRAARLKFLVDAPKRPPSAKALFVQRKREESEATDGGLEGGAVVAARSSKLWEKMSEAETGPFEREAARLSEEFQKAMQDFRESEAYRELKAAESKAGAKGKAKARGKARAKGAAKAKGKGKAKRKARPKASSLVTRPESMPAKPPSAYQLYCKEQQANGKTCSRTLFAALPEDETKRLNIEVVKLQKQFAEDLAKFMTSKDGKRYKRKLESAAHKQKVARAKEKLKEAQPSKPLSAFRLFVESIKGDKGGRPAERWTRLSEAERKRWEEEHEKLMVEYQKAMVDFQKSASYKKFERAAKPKGKARAKGPEGMPKRPPSPFLFFVKERSKEAKESGKSLNKDDMCKAWAELGSDGQQKYMQQCKTALAAYQEDMKLWRKTKEGKKAVQADRRLQKKQTEDKLKEKHLKAPNAPQPPEKPKSAKMLFLEERRKQILKEEGPEAGGPREMAARLVKEWESLSADGRKVWESKEKSLLDVYEFELEEYQSSETYQKYTKALAKKGCGKGKGRSSAGRKRKGDELSFDSDEMGSDSSSDGISD